MWAVKSVLIRLCSTMSSVTIRDWVFTWNESTRHICGPVRDKEVPQESFEAAMISIAEC